MGCAPDADRVTVYVGRLVGSESPDIPMWEDLIGKVERLLIYVHTPAYNSSGLNTLPPVDLEDVHVLNWGNYRSLLPEVSGRRWAPGSDKAENKTCFRCGK